MPQPRQDRQASPRGAAGRWLRELRFGSSRRRRVAEAAAFAAPLALLLSLALSGGGYDLNSRGELDLDERNLAALASWGIVIVLLVFAGAPRLRVRKPLLISVALLAGLAALCALSSSWSGAAERSLNEADRVIAYLGFFLAALALSQTGKQRQRFAEGLAVAAAVLALLGLGSRLLPGVTDLLPHAISPAASDPGASRLTYPLGYWNAAGVMFGIAVALLAWASRHTSPALRWTASAALPATMLAAYFTYSRGAVLAGILALTVLLALSRDRLWYLAVTAISLAAVVPAVAATQDR